MKGHAVFLTIKLRTALIVACGALLITGAPLAFSAVSAAVQPEPENPKLAIIIDDFGQDRSGVKEMLALPCPITAAVLPFMQFSEKDAQNAFELGREVIVHLPMQSSFNDNPRWFPPGRICIGDSREEAYEKTASALAAVPHAVGANIHVGSKSSERQEVVLGVISACLEKGLYFVDSRTSPKSACREAAKLLPVFYGERNFFLEHGDKSEAHVKDQLKKAAKYAKSHGAAIVIGHVGAAGGTSTARAIEESLAYLEEEGVTLVPASEIVRIFAENSLDDAEKRFHSPAENTDTLPGSIKSESGGNSKLSERSDIE